MVWLIAAVVSAAVVLSAPFMGQIRAALRTAFPTGFVAIVGGAVALAIGGAIVTALVRIRDRRRARYGVIGAALALGIGYSMAFATGTPEVDVVERVHFVEYGLITFLFYRASRTFDDLSVLVLPVLAGLLVGTLEEWFQWFIPVRVGEARDVLLNLVAIACGLLFSVGIDPPRRFTNRLTAGAVQRLGAASAVVLLVFASFVYVVHAGYELVDEQAGTFKSRYTRVGLEALAADREARWRTDPPTEFRRISREDQYIDEALWHVRRRNTAWSEGDVARAWGENLILEKYFKPMLDTPTYTASNLHRWPPEQRADAARRVSGFASNAFVSDAEPYPIITWPHAVYWSVVGLLLAVVAAGTATLGRRSSASRAEDPAAASYR
jgi:hypothetical protein